MTVPVIMDTVAFDVVPANAVFRVFGVREVVDPPENVGLRYILTFNDWNDVLVRTSATKLTPVELLLEMTMTRLWLLVNDCSCVDTLNNIPLALACPGRRSMMRGCSTESLNTLIGFDIISYPFSDNLWDSVVYVRYVRFSLLPSTIVDVRQWVVGLTR